MSAIEEESKPSILVPNCVRDSDPSVAVYLEIPPGGTRKGGRVTACGCPHKLSPNPADHRKLTKPAKGGADGYLSVSTDYHHLRIRLGSWKIEEAPLFIRSDLRVRGC